MKKSIKKILVDVSVITLIIGCLSAVMACSSKTSDSGQTDVDYKYASYVYDDNEPQYYMSDSAAAAETGYYYIAGASGVSDNTNSYMRLFHCVPILIVTIRRKTVRHIYHQICVLVVRYGITIREYI